MPKTLVMQSHRDPLPHTWLRACLDSVAAWADDRGYEYQFIGDELFTPIAADLLEKTRAQPVIATDLARLLWLRRALREDCERAVWCDADFLIFDPAAFTLPDEPLALGREVWIQAAADGRLRSYVKVHNAFLMFGRDNPFLDFYADTAERLLRLNQGRMPPQFIGPKLLTALHNLARLPVLESAGMLSPPVIRDLLAGGGAALDLLRADSAVMPAGVNLGASLAPAEGLDERQMSALIRLLCRDGL